MVHIKLGTTGRLDNLQAGILLEKFKGFEEDMNHRREAAQYYNEKLKDIVKVPKVAEYTKSVHALELNPQPLLRWIFRLPSR